MHKKIILHIVNTVIVFVFIYTANFLTVFNVYNIFEEYPYNYSRRGLQNKNKDYLSNQGVDYIYLAINKNDLNFLAGVLVLV